MADYDDDYSYLHSVPEYVSEEQPDGGPWIEYQNDDEVEEAGDEYENESEPENENESDPETELESECEPEAQSESSDEEVEDIENSDEEGEDIENSDEEGEDIENSDEEGEDIENSDEEGEDIRNSDEEGEDIGNSDDAGEDDDDLVEDEVAEHTDHETTTVNINNIVYQPTHNYTHNEKHDGLYSYTQEKYSSHESNASNKDASASETYIDALTQKTYLDAPEHTHYTDATVTEYDTNASDRTTRVEDLAHANHIHASADHLSHFPIHRSPAHERTKDTSQGNGRDSTAHEHYEQSSKTMQKSSRSSTQTTASERTTSSFHDRSIGAMTERAKSKTSGTFHNNSHADNAQHSHSNHKQSAKHATSVDTAKSATPTTTKDHNSSTGSGFFSHLFGSHRSTSPGSDMHQQPVPPSPVASQLAPKPQSQRVPDHVAASNSAPPNSNTLLAHTSHLHIHPKSTHPAPSPSPHLLAIDTHAQQQTEKTTQMIPQHNTLSHKPPTSVRHAVAPVYQAPKSTHSFTQTTNHLQYPAALQVHKPSATTGPQRRPLVNTQKTTPPAPAAKHHLPVFHHHQTPSISGSSNHHSSPFHHHHQHNPFPSNEPNHPTSLLPHGPPLTTAAAPAHATPSHPHHPSLPASTPNCGPNVRSQPIQPLLDTLLSSAPEFDKHGSAMYTLGFTNSTKGAAKMRKKGMTMHCRRKVRDGIVVGVWYGVKK
jgi:hypothetical protein